MDRAMRFRANTPHVVHQTIDGEVVIINLESGCYYSLDSVAADVWALLEAGATLGEAVHALGSRYAAAAATIEGALGEFVVRLCDERLIVPSLDATPSGGVNDAAAVDDGRRAFEPPTLQKYTDMQDLLLIDPIHEVDDLGWPGVKPVSLDR